MPAHVYGNQCQAETSQQIADKHNLKVQYDAAHALGEAYKDESVAQMGNAYSSFHVTEVFHTLEGSCLTFLDDESDESLKKEACGSSGRCWGRMSISMWGRTRS